MIRRCLIMVSMLLLLASCRKKEPETVLTAIRVELQEAGAFRASFKVQAVQCSCISYGLSEDMPMSVNTPSAGVEQVSLSLDGLEPLSDYILYAQGIGPKGEKGSVVKLAFSTVAGPSSLYPWEKARQAVPAFADISLVTLGRHNYNPPAWTRERFDSHVRYTDADGAQHWLFDAFLCIDGWDGARGLSYSIANNRHSAIKESWEDLLDAWLGADGALLQLDAAIESAKASLGRPPHPRYIVMSLPDPIRYEYFSDKSSASVYWGDLDGKALDFSSTDDQLAAYKWYMDRCRELFHARLFNNLELAGFYILSEELPLEPAFYTANGESYGYGDTYNWEYKNWEILVPQVASYAHSCVEGLWWIPYHLAPGYKVWRPLGFDNVFMQPNYYWDHDSVSHPMESTVEALKRYRMGIEIEFEYSLVAEVMSDGRSGPDGSGNPTFYLADVPMLRSRVREYMDAYRSSGMYGVKPVAVYSGTDAWHQLASSKEKDDIAMYLELCRFISENPLKK